MTNSDMPAGGSPDNPTNPTMAQFEAMVAADRAAAAADGNFNLLEGDPVEREAISDRAKAAMDALYYIRPTDPAVLVAWLRWMIDNLVDDEHGNLSHVAEQLERLGRQQPAANLPASAWADIEAALVKNHRRWTYRNAEQCISRRCELLAQAAALPIRSDADAAAALMIAMRMGDHDLCDDEGAWINTGPPEDAPRGEIARSVQHYLAERRS